VIRLWKWGQHQPSNQIPKLNCAELDQCPCSHRWPLFHRRAKCKDCDCYSIFGRIVKPTIVRIP